MQPISILYTLLFSVVSLASTTKTTPFLSPVTPTPPPTQTSAIAAALQSYNSMLATATSPPLVSIRSLLATALPASVYDTAFAGFTYIRTDLDLAAIPAFTALPSEARSYVSSVVRAERSLVDGVVNGGSGLMPTGAVGKAVAGVVGVLGFGVVVG